MKMKLTRDEAEFMSFVLEERRIQMRALEALHVRHNKHEAKRLIDSFPYDKGSDLPYVCMKSDQNLLIWDPETHDDLLRDLRDHYTERSANPSAGDFRVAHNILVKIEAATANVHDGD